VRKVIEITITDAGRDFNKTFELTELAADVAEWWAIRALLALAKSGVDIGGDANGGMQQLAVLGIQSLGAIDPVIIKPLLDEMWSCVRIKEKHIVRGLMDEDIEEVTTRLRLRAEVFSLHTGFLLPGTQSKSTLETPPDSPNTETFRHRSERRSAAAKPR
jgi:hypothetical protein